MRRTTHLFAMAICMQGCGFFGNLLGSTSGIDGAAFSTNMDKYEIESIDLVFPGNDGTFCPGTSGTFVVTAQGHKKKKPGAQVTLETAVPGADAKDTRGKMDLGEFAMEGRGGTVERGTFTASSDPFEALLGFDVRATYRLDTKKVVETHFEPVYTCITSIGGSGAEGDDGDGGDPGQDGGGAGGTAGPGSQGGAGPRLVAHVTIVRTPKHDKVGLVQVTGDREQMTLFDLTTGITVSARGGDGGSGGRGGSGGDGSDPAGPGGPGGTGGPGGPGGDGGEAIVVLDARYPELASVVQVDVSGGAPGSGGSGGSGGDGGDAPPKACDDCKRGDPGPDGADGQPGSDGTVTGQSGKSEVRSDDLASVFASLPPGVRLLE